MLQEFKDTDSLIHYICCENILAFLNAHAPSLCQGEIKGLCFSELQELVIRNSGKNPFSGLDVDDLHHGKINFV